MLSRPLRVLQSSTFPFFIASILLYRALITAFSFANLLWRFTLPIQVDFRPFLTSTIHCSAWSQGNPLVTDCRLVPRIRFFFARASPIPRLFQHVILLSRSWRLRGKRVLLATDRIASCYLLPFSGWGGQNSPLHCCCYSDFERWKALMPMGKEVLSQRDIKYWIYIYEIEALFILNYIFGIMYNRAGVL